MTRKPLDADEFARLMHTILPLPPSAVAVAVSGGADSMALALLSSSWAAERTIALHALTVDHRLRPESAEEAAQVDKWLANRNIPHHILPWDITDKPKSNIQAHARDARYHLITEWCRNHNISHLLLAHHLDDQAETFLIRLGRGSGVDGLSAMLPVTSRNGLTLLRPLLDIPKSRLVATLKAEEQEWLEDPSNHKPQFTRTKMRTLLPLLADAGIDATTLAATAGRMARARDYLEQQTARSAADCLIAHEAGYLLLDYELFSHLHVEIALRVLALALGSMSRTAYRPRFSELKALFDALTTPRTLAGCKFEPAGDKLHILREPAAVASPRPLTPGQWEWDNRFRVTVSAPCADLTLGALGVAGWKHIRRTAPEMAAMGVTLPRTALHTLPAVWHLEKPVFVPHINYSDPGTALLHGAIRVDRLPSLGYT